VRADEQAHSDAVFPFLAAPVRTKETYR
jgi:hypothetical protein